VSSYEAQLRALAEAVEIVAPGLARVTDVRGGVRETAVAGERGPFMGLAAALYAARYNACEDASPALEDATFLPALAGANVIPQRFTAAGPAQREGVTGPGGHYVIFGRPVVMAQSGRQVRFYWNLTSQGGAPFVRAVGAAFERFRMPFQAKVPAHAGGYARTDGGVLYLADEDVDVACDAIEDVYGRVRPFLRDDVPLFALGLAPGVAFAESPPNGESFGMHRCDLVAEGLVRAHERGERDVAARVATVRERLVEYGLDVERLAFNPATRYPYRFPRFAAEAAA